MRATSIFAFLCLATQIEADQLACPDPFLKVVGGDHATRERTCAAASEARSKLADCNVVLDRSLEIEIVESLDTSSTSCLGLYHCGEDRIEILSPRDLAAARDKGGAFEMVSDMAYWQSIIAHELTHAAYDTVDCPFVNCVETTEYAAYAMQVYVLPPSEKALFGTTVTLRGRPVFDAISSVLLYMAPDRFAKTAWLHFQGRDEPCAYMRLIMEGQIFFDREPP